MKRVKIDPITRLEGHGKIEIFLDNSGKVQNAYFQVPELRGFEKFCVGRHAEEMPVITNRICGVCPEAHHMASVKALDTLFGVEPTMAAKRIRELFYMAFFVTDHTTHFFALGGPDFIVGPDAPPGERNLLGVVNKLGLDAGKRVIACRARNHHVIEMLGGRGVHPSAGVPGGWSKRVSEAERNEIERAAEENVEFAKLCLNVFSDLVLGNNEYMDLITSEIYTHRTYYMGTVDLKGQMNFHNGTIRVVDPEGGEYTRYAPELYASQLAERVEQWTYLKFPYLRNVGWKGFKDGMDSGVYTCSPLSRLNVSDGMATPLAQKEFERFYETFGSERYESGRYAPVHYRLATHWARLIELMYASERMLVLSRDGEITSEDIRNVPSLETITGEGIGSVEAPRGTLTHHYKSDERGVLTSVNLIVGTTNNHAPISMSIKRAAEGLINGGGQEDDQGVLNRIEMAFRLYDPCLSCATHSLPGAMPLRVDVRDAEGRLLRSLRRRM